MIGKGLARFVAAALLPLLAGPAGALDFEISDSVKLKMVNKFTIGAGVRTQDFDNDNLGVLNVPGQQNLCKNLDTDCLSFGVGGSFRPGPNQSLVNAGGGFFLHAADDGDMNYHNGEVYTGISKLNADWTLNWGEWTFKTNFVGYFDAVNSGFEIHRFNTVGCTGANPSSVCKGADINGFDDYNLGENRRARSGEIENRLAVRGEFREYFVTRNFTLGDYEIFATLGNQRLRWGEANLTLLNTLDVINPQDAVLARQPGLALNELNLPTGLLSVGSDIMEGVSVDAWYQYAWDPVRPEPAGSLFSNLSDAAGGGSYAVIALGQYPEDPDGLWFSTGVTGLISNSHRTIYIPDEKTHAPSDQGQYGLRVKLYLPEFNNGTELGFYFANYHSRLPYASVYAAQDSCLREAGTFAEAANLCDGFNAASNRGQNATVTPVRCDPRGCSPLYLSREPLPIDTMGVFLDFPENIQMYGVSFNTTAGGWSFAGEYAFRPNLPAQLLLSDVVFAALQPVVGRVQMPFTMPGPFVPDPAADPNTGTRVQELLSDFAVYAGTHPGEDPQNAALPDATTIFPSYTAAYRGYNNASAATDINGGQYIPGYERLKVGQFALTALQLFSTNPFGSDDLLMVYEVGFTHVVDMPKRNTTLGKGLYFQGAGDQSHPSPGADDPNLTVAQGRINPTQQKDGFADAFAWGLRGLIQLNYSNLFDAGLTVKPTALMFWDVNGIAPAPMQNYVENSRWLVPALFFEYGSAWSGTLIYQYFGGGRSALADRDNISASITYAF